MDALFEQKYAECEKALYLTALGYLHNTEDAKDCVQEAAVSAFCAFDKLRNKTLFKTWITRILINKAKDFLKKQRYTEELCDNLNICCEIPDADMDIINGICALKPELSIYITLRFYSDMTYDEVAKTLKQPVSTVKYRTKSALMELKSILEGADNGEN